MKTGRSLHAKRKRVIVELVKGKEMATQLQTLLRIPGQDHGSSSVSPGDLAFQILRSFNKTLSVLSTSSSAATASPQIAAVDCGGSACSGESKQKPGVKSRRGCYKRRRSCESWTKICSVVEDGYAWRKYGQKDILDSQYPRCYFRCTHKYEGCKATKQVQRIKEEPILYQITYFNHHTCTETPRAPPIIFDPNPNLVDPNVLSFQTGNSLKQEGCHSTDPEIKKVECSKENEGEGVFDAISYLLDPWQEMIESELFGYKSIWGPMTSFHQDDGGSELYSCGSTSLHGLDIDNYFHF
ncbi:UNVERIFIED_CONTAM: WRKY DNA-binding transcription factor 70 [Sesamum latifolium]|uniref:WRKY DNA-binding transcription factor 70 n=1 Tax=Sesamum latifolium TaxID=2727402 RepID=A0AAW2XIJ8_9LAMI